MEKDFIEFISVRCQRALEENKDYMSDELSGTIDQDELQARAESLCYIKGFRDFAKLIGIDSDALVAMVAKVGSQK